MGGEVVICTLSYKKESDEFQVITISQLIVGSKALTMEKIFTG